MNKSTGSRGLWAHLDTLVTALIVAIAGSVVLFTNFSGQGRLWDRIAGNNADAAPPAAANVVRVTAPSAAGDRMMVVPPPETAAAPTAAVPAPAKVAAVSPAPAPQKPNWIKHLTGSLPSYSITGPATQHSSAQASAVNAPAASATPAAAAAEPSQPEVAAAVHAVARPSYVNYGAATRSDIMSSASGPVYNFTGKKK